MKIRPSGKEPFLPPLPGEEGKTGQEEAMKKVGKARKAVEQERLEIMDRHHENLRKSAETYEKQARKKAFEKEIEKRLLQSREFLEKSIEEAEIRSKTQAQRPE